MIKFDDFKQLWEEAKKYDSVNVYIMERGWQQWMNGLDAETVVQLLTDVYNCSQGSINKIFEHYKTLKKASDVLCIPYSTCQKWVGGIGSPSEYAKLWIAYITICGN